MSIRTITKKQFKLINKQQLSEYITGIAWSSDGNLAMITAAGELAIWQKGELNLLTSPNCYSLDSLGFSNDGTYIAVAGQRGEVKIWQIIENNFKLVIKIDNKKAWIDSLYWHPQENILAYVVNRQIKIWNADNQQEITSLDFKDSSVFSLAWHPEGHLLAASGHGGVKVWHKQDWQKTPYLLQVPGASLDCAWSADGTYLASGNLDRTISLLHWDNPPPWLMQGFPGKVSQVTWSQSAKPLLAASCQEGVTIWQYRQNNWQNYILKHAKTVKAIAFAPNSSLLAVAGDDGKISLWQNNKLIKSLKGINIGLSCLAWDLTGKYLAAGGQNGELLIYQESVSGKGFGN